MNAQIQVVATFIKYNVNGTVNKTKFAAEHNISTRTLGRWIEKYEVEARQMIEAEKAPKTSKNAASSKRDLAAKVFTNNGHLTRKNMIAMMVGTCGLTAAGASTYISNFKTGKWEI